MLQLRVHRRRVPRSPAAASIRPTIRRRLPTPADVPGHGSDYEPTGRTCAVNDALVPPRRARSRPSSTVTRAPSSCRTRRCASATSPAPSASCRSNPTDPLHRTLFVAVRGDPSITRIDVHFPGSTSGNPTPRAGRRSPSLNPRRSTIRASSSASTIRAALRIARRYDRRNAGAGTVRRELPRAGLLLPEPADLHRRRQQQRQDAAADRAVRHGHRQFESGADRRLLVSHLATGQVSVIDIDAPPSMALLSESIAVLPARPDRAATAPSPSRSRTRPIRTRCGT